MDCGVELLLLQDEENQRRLRIPPEELDELRGLDGWMDGWI